MMSSTKSALESQQSKCEVLRRKGNELYMQMSRGGLGIPLARCKLDKAHIFYQQALAESLTGDERASCYKNLGALNWLWGKTEWQSYVHEEMASTTAVWASKSRLADSIQFYLQALHYGNLAKRELQWIAQVEESLYGIVNWIHDQLSVNSSSFEPILKFLFQTLENSETDWSGKRRLAVLLCTTHAEVLIQEGANCLEGEKSLYGYKRCLNLMRDCYTPLTQAESILHLSNDTDLVKAVKGLQDQVLHYQTVCESIQARAEGDDILEKAMSGKMDMVWEAIDCYKYSLRHTREKDLKNEAIALSRIGKSYSEVLKMEKQAHPYHFQSMTIALTIMSPQIAKAEWYVYSVEKVKKHQQTVVDDEKREKKEKRENTVQRMKVQLDAIEAEGGKSAESFLKFIYSTHPHPDLKKRTMGSFGSPENVKAALRTAIVAYHPDTNMQQDDDWQVLSEEITKILNRKYEFFK